jgi:hypothetical protein
MKIEHCLIITNSSSIIQATPNENSFSWNKIYTDKSLPQWLMWLIRKYTN